MIRRNRVFTYAVISLYVVISGDWTMSDCDTAEGDYQGALYDIDPFHDPTAQLLLGPVPMLNLYERMPMIGDPSDL